MASLLNAPMVIFLEVLDHYCCNRDLSCKLKISSNYEIKEIDKVSIFKLGWNNINEAVIKKPIPEVSQEGVCCVTFKCDELPRDCLNLYQICYISDQELQGASSPFDFCDLGNATISESFCSKLLPSFDSINRFQNGEEKTFEIFRLKERNASLQEENEILRNSLKVFLNEKLESQEKCCGCDKEIAELKKLFDSLHLTVSANDKDIKMLKKKITEGGEEYKRLYLEKCKVEKKYERLKNAYREQSIPRDGHSLTEVNLDLSNLPSLPPIPSMLDA